MRDNTATLIYTSILNWNLKERGLEVEVWHLIGRPVRRTVADSMYYILNEAFHEKWWRDLK